jgi:hypothetical protein
VRGLCLASGQTGLAVVLMLVLVQGMDRYRDAMMLGKGQDGMQRVCCVRSETIRGKASQRAGVKVSTILGSAL